MAIASLASHVNYRDWHRDANTQYQASRLQVEELTKNQDVAFLQLVLADLKGHVMVEAEQDMAKALVTAKHKLKTYVPESEFKKACLSFDQQYVHTNDVEMRVNEAALIEKRRRQKRKRPSEQDEHRDPKKQKGEKHHYRHRHNRSWQKKATSARK